MDLAPSTWEGTSPYVIWVGPDISTVASAWSPSRDSDVKHPTGPPKALLLSELGWSKAQRTEARRRVAGLEYLWDDPSMDAYDDL